MTETPRDIEETNATNPIGKTEKFVSKHFVRLLVWLAVSGGALAIFGPWLLYVAGLTGETDANLRLHILYVTGGTIAVLGLVETHRKNTTDRIKADADIQNYQASQSHQAKMLDEQARQFTENIAKEREKIEADKAKSEQDYIRQVHAERRSRYATAIEQLSNDKASIRLGGVYTLVGLVDEWLADEKTIPDIEERRKEGQVIINNLCAYIRSPFLLTERAEQLDKPYAKDLQKDFGGDKEKFDANKIAFSRDKAALEEERQIRQSIIKEIRERLQGIGTQDPWSKFDYDFSNAHFFYPIDFTYSYFGASLQFSGATFSGYAEFCGTNFAQIANFSKANFTRDTDFSKANFTGVGFSRATFAERANFTEATFTQGADFTEANFTGVGFSRATFAERANFTEATFTQGADFTEAKFTRNAIFLGATFTQGADFPKTFYNFPKTPFDFSEVKFIQHAIFVGATFTQGANFSNAIFTGNADFTEADFNFSEVKFIQHAIFVGATFTQGANFSNAIFTGNADFTEADFDFSGATFDFSGATFIQGADFSEAQFIGNTDFSKASFTVNNDDLCGTVYTELSMATFDFSESIFDGYVFFSCATFAERVDFTEAIFTRGASFSGTTFHGDPIFAFTHLADDCDYETYEAKFSCRVNPTDYNFEADPESPYKIETEEQEHNGIKFIIPKDTELFDPDDPSN